MLELAVWVKVFVPVGGGVIEALSASVVLCVADVVSELDAVAELLKDSE